MRFNVKPESRRAVDDKYATKQLNIQTFQTPKLFKLVFLLSNRSSFL
jgi:hypothetical protein